ncbi:MAG: hypothetical protein ACLRRT_05365 [Ruthenibacterium lactatiformans]
MNGNCSTTGCKNLRDCPAARTIVKSIDWKKAEAEVNELCQIIKATENKWNTVSNYLLTHSYYAKVLVGKCQQGKRHQAWMVP